jgi:predicted  nucleic acid-binding Zn-ribbon protein
MINLAKKLYDLQLIDLEIKNIQSSISEIDRRLQDNETINSLKRDLDKISGDAVEVDRKKKDLEWDTEDIQKNIKQVNTKLYGGTVKNPKELIGFEQEAKSLKLKLKEKEDELLDLMTAEEDLTKHKQLLKNKLRIAENEWEKEGSILLADKKNLEVQLSGLTKQREQHMENMEDEALKLYEKISAKKGFAVVRVEQGRCQGCRLSISMSEMQRARGGSLVQCSSCGMILYL